MLQDQEDFDSRLRLPENHLSVRENEQTIDDFDTIMTKIRSFNKDRSDSEAREQIKFLEIKIVQSHVMDQLMAVVSEIGKEKTSIRLIKENTALQEKIRILV